MSDWLVSIVERECPTGYGEDARLDDLFDLWERYVGPVDEHADADFEDFWEQAYRLDAAISAFGASNIWLVTNWVSRRARHLTTGMTASLRELSHLPRYGSQPDWFYGPDEDPQWAAGDYMRDRAFIANAGRQVRLCAFDIALPEMVDEAWAMVRDGITKVVVKAARTKHGIWTVDLSGATSREDVSRALWDALDWAPLSQRGFLLQEWVPMRYEYRLFVVDHEVVAGAGCVEEFTPLDNDATFDPKMRRDRSDRMSLVEEKPDLTERYVRFGQVVAAMTRTERPECSDYTLDVAMGSNGKPLVIERNGLLNSGLYASQPELVTEAMARARREVAA